MTDERQAGLREALETCFTERDDCRHGQWDAVSGDHFAEHLDAALAAQVPVQEERLDHALRVVFGNDNVEDGDAAAVLALLAPAKEEGA